MLKDQKTNKKLKAIKPTVDKKRRIVAKSDSFPAESTAEQWLKARCI